MKVKRTYNLSSGTVAAVRESVERDHLAPSQDALIELALADFFMRLRHEQEARQFAAAAADPSIAAEFVLLAEEFRGADGETWPE